MKIPLNLTHQLVYYVGIGALAASIHVLAVFLLVHYAGLDALFANVFAFLIAFNCSFFGHRYLTFATLHNEKKLSLPHYFLVAASGGMMNEGLYFLILRSTHLNYLFALILVLILVAVYSFLLARYWACR